MLTVRLNERHVNCSLVCAPTTASSARRKPRSWVIAGDGQAIAGKVDASILVVRAWQEQRGLVSRLAGQLGQAKAAFLGVILNRPRNTAGGYFRKNFEAMASYASDAKD